MVLVAASPCALAIAVPVTVVAAIGAASRLGVVVKGGAALEALGTIRTIALDKPAPSLATPPPSSTSPPPPELTGARC